jgi:hypothetical protein
LGFQTAGFETFAGMCSEGLALRAHARSVSHCMNVVFIGPGFLGPKRLLWLVLLNISIRRSYMLVSSFSHAKRLFPVMPVISLFLTLLILSHRHHRYVSHFTSCRCFPFLPFFQTQSSIKIIVILLSVLLTRNILFLFCLTDITGVRLALTGHEPSFLLSRRKFFSKSRLQETNLRDHPS